MNFTRDKRQSAVAGVLLITLGLVWWLNLWWLLWPGALVAAGVAMYIQRRAMGRVIEAVQGGLWGVGLGLLFLAGFVWPGLLFLAGASILLRGREHEVDTRVQGLLGRARRSSGGAIQRASVQQAPPEIYRPTVEVEPEQRPAVGETTRLP